MLRIVPVNTNIDFMSKSKICIAISVILIVITFAGLIFKGLNYGIDFSGGTLIQIKTENEPSIADLRSSLKTNGFEGAAIQRFGADDEFVIRVQTESGENSDEVTKQIVNSINGIANNVEVRRVEFVGPQVGKELRKTGVIALLFSLLAILAYVSIRFEFRYAVGAVAALFHDVILTVGMFILLQKEVSLPVLAALLTVIGYSLNDTIVVFDRVRETRGKNPKKNMRDVLNVSINAMLNRTLMTSLTTVAVLFALYLFGGEVINGFAFTLIFGVIVGTYSSIYVAAAVVLSMENHYQKLAKQMEEESIGFKG